MGILLGELPESVEIDGIVYAVNYGYRTFIQIEACIFDGEISDTDRILYSLSLFYADNIPQNIADAFIALLDFYRGGEKKETIKSGSRSTTRCYDFEVDGGRIYAAFLAQYKIDLVTVSSKDLHWWLFKALFDALDDTHQICKIMMYRSIDLAAVSKNQKKFYAEQKKRYALKTICTADARASLSARDADLIARVQAAHRSRSKGG